MGDAYVHLCGLCHHLASRHRLSTTTDIIRPYLCPCGCRYFHGDPVIGLSRSEYETRFPTVPGGAA